MTVATYSTLESVPSLRKGFVSTAPVEPCRCDSPKRLTWYSEGREEKSLSSGSAPVSDGWGVLFGLGISDESDITVVLLDCNRQWG